MDSFYGMSNDRCIMSGARGGAQDIFHHIRKAVGNMRNNMRETVIRGFNLALKQFMRFDKEYNYLATHKLAVHLPLLLLLGLLSSKLLQTMAPQTSAS